MQLQTTQLTKLTITDVPALGPIEVIVEDTAPKEGRITITCHRETWAYFWADLTAPLAHFFSQQGVGYLLSKLAPGTPASEVDFATLVQLLRSEITRRRRQDAVTRDAARFMWPVEAQIRDLDEAELLAYVGDALGVDDATYRIPRRPTERYAYLKRVFSAVQEAFREQASPVCTAGDRARDPSPFNPDIRYMRNTARALRDEDAATQAGYWALGRDAADYLDKLSTFLETAAVPVPVELATAGLAGDTTLGRLLDDLRKAPPMGDQKVGDSAHGKARKALFQHLAAIALGTQREYFRVLDAVQAAAVALPDLAEDTVLEPVAVIEELVARLFHKSSTTDVTLEVSNTASDETFWETERKLFEQQRPMPDSCLWTGRGYAATEFNAWQAHGYCDVFKGWLARARAPQPIDIGALARRDRAISAFIAEIFESKSLARRDSLLEDIVRAWGNASKPYFHTPNEPVGFLLDLEGIGLMFVKAEDVTPEHAMRANEITALFAGVDPAAPEAKADD